MVVDRNIRYIIAGVLAVIIYIFVIDPMILAFKYRSRVVHDYKRYMWVLKDSIELCNKLGNDTLFSSTGRVTDDYQYFNYNLKGGLVVHVFDFKALRDIKPYDVEINYVDGFESFKKRMMSQLNGDIKKWPIVNIKFNLEFKDSLTINIDNEAKLKEIRNNTNCKAFYGKLTTMSLNNLWNEPLVLYDFSTVSKVILSLYRNKSRFLIIIITSNNTLEPEKINILNLDPLNR